MPDIIRDLPRRDLLVDATLALGVAGIVAVVALRAEEPDARSPAVAAYLLAAVVGGLLLVRRRWPVPVLVSLATAVLIYHAYGFPGVGFVWPLLVGLYTAAAAGRLFTTILVTGGMLGIQAAWLLFGAPLPQLPPLPLLTMVATDAIIAGLAIALGDAVHSRRGWAAETQERLRRVSDQTRREALREIIDERLRIAREFHDVTAHTLTVVALQINVALDALDPDPAAARAALRTARQVSDQAIRELTAAIRVLRAADGPADRTPLPGLADLDQLVAGIRATGLAVEFRRSGGEAVAELPAAAALTVYRVAQEALTNVVKHAGAAHAQLEVGYHPDAVIVRVTDDGPGAAFGGDPGHGLRGLRERVTGLGGRLTAGPSDRGFTVEAWVPTGEAGT